MSSLKVYSLCNVASSVEIVVSYKEMQKLTWLLFILGATACMVPWLVIWYYFGVGAPHLPSKHSDIFRLILKDSFPQQFLALFAVW